MVIQTVDDSSLMSSTSLLFVYGSSMAHADHSGGIPSGSYQSSSIGSREASLLGTIKTNEYSWSSMCTMWLQVATLAHDFTSSQEVTCRYALCTVASLMVPLFHSATLRGHVRESLMHPDERLRPRSRYSMHEGIVTTSTRTCWSRCAGGRRRSCSTRT